jgi:spore germination cell wall hydrolase CwlJ-like protein
MEPIKLPEEYTRPVLLTRIMFLLLVGSILLNISLWQSLFKQGQELYDRVSTPPAVETSPILAAAETAPMLAATLDEKELTCMATNIYHESANQSDLGKVAVAMVVLNRVDNDGFPNTICDVVKQPSRNPNNPRGCQFSWTCDGKSDSIRDHKKYQQIVDLSRNILLSRDNMVDIVDGALYYHAVYVNPSWAKYFERVARIDTHIFYKDKL